MRLYGKVFLGNIFIFVVLSLLFSIGLMVLYSSTCLIQAHFTNFFIKQCFGFGIGVLIAMGISFFTYREIIAWGKTIHYVVIILLIFTLLKGKIAMGGQRWIDLFFFKFQPAELAKISLPLWISNYFMANVIESPKKSDWLFLLLGIFFTFILIFKQPDLGTAVVVAASGMLMLFIAGMPRKITITIFISALVVFPIVWRYVLYDYQKKRILVYLGQGSSLKERYQIEQSKIAIGSGGFSGKGYLQGTQKNLNFLPENRTDFIFSVFAEEFGFLGVTFLILLFMIVFLKFIHQSFFIDESNALILAFGVSMHFIISVVGNIGMAVGILPIVGIPLPCMSYGISHTWSTCIMIGILNTIIREAD